MGRSLGTPPGPYYADTRGNIESEDPDRADQVRVNGSNDGTIDGVESLGMEPASDNAKGLRRNKFAFWRERRAGSNNLRLTI